MSLFRFLSLLVFFNFGPNLIAQTASPGMTYQGRLTDASNTPVPDGTSYEIEVRVWSAQTGGTLVWGNRSSAVAVRGGAFNLILGAPGAVPIAGAAVNDIAFAFNSPERFIGITVRKSADGSPITNPTEILPRQQVFSVPFAFRSDASGTATSVQPNGVLSAAIKDGEVKAPDIGLGQVSTSAIADAAITPSKIAPGAVTNASIAVGALAIDRTALEYASFSEERPANGANGTAATGWETRILNTTNAMSGNSITRDGNNVTLKPGIYYVEGSAPVYAANSHVAILRNISSNETAVRGTTEYSYGGFSTTLSRSLIRGFVTVSDSPQTFDIYHYKTTGGGSRWLGAITNDGVRNEPCVFSQLTIIRIK